MKKFVGLRKRSIKRVLAILLTEIVVFTGIPFINIGIEETYAIDYMNSIVSNDNIKSVRLCKGVRGVLKTDGSLWMCGANNYGQLGNGTTVDSYKPEKILEDVKVVRLEGDISAAIKNDGSLWMWGRNSSLSIDSDTPKKMMENVKDIQVCGDVGAVVKEDGSLWMWGKSQMGVLGNYTEVSINKPIKFLEKIRQIILKSDYAVVINEDDNLYTWGKNVDGRLGNGDFDGIVYEPTLILTDVKSIVANSSNISAIKNDNTLWKWGDNSSGQIGDGDSSENRWDKPSPVKVLEDVRCISSNYSAAVKLDGSLWTWGHRYDGRMNQYDMVPVKRMDEVKMVFGFHDAYWIIKDDWSLWKRNIDGYRPESVFMLDDVENFYRDDSESYELNAAAVQRDGSLWMWGTNWRGQLGNNEYDKQYLNTPIKVLIDNEITSVTKISGVENHYYGVNSYKNTPEGDIYDDSVAFISAMDNYLTQLRNATQKDIQTINKSSKSSAQLLKEADAKTNDKIITMEVTAPDAAMDSVYETLSQYLDMYVETGVSLGKIDMSASTIDISTSIVNKIRNNLDSLDFTRKVGKYTVTFKILKFMGAYTGSVTVQGNGRTYTGIIVSNSKETAKVLTTYINDMSEWVEDALYQSLKVIFTELTDVTGISDFTKKEINALLKDKVELLQSNGYGNLLAYCVAMRDGWL